ncbi:MAG TPA: MFS transporter [Ilumatobacter sp.]|nr:MFS transporter [Ilumatobacter sp.]
MTRRDPPAGSRRAALRERNFWPYCIGSLLSNCGTWFQNIGQTLLVYRLTGSVFLVGVVGLAQFAGVFVVGPAAGIAADRFDRRRLLLTTQACGMTITIGLAITSATGHANVPVVVAVALALGFLQALSVPSQLALVADLVKPENLPAAVTLNIVTFNGARAIGPVLGALAVAQLGVSAAFAANACSFLGLGIALLVIKPRQRTRRAASEPRPKVVDSVRLVARRPALARVFVVAAAGSFAIDPITTLSPEFATKVFDAPDTLVGWFVGAFGVGAVVAAFVVTASGLATDRVIGMRGLTLAGAMVVFALSDWLWLSLAALFVAGTGYIGLSTLGLTRLQMTTESSEHGRLMALWSIAFTGSRPIAGLIDGALANPLGVRWATLVVLVPLVVCAARMVASTEARTPVATAAATGPPV